MTPEGLHFDRKSLRKVTGKGAAWAELALDRVAFANAQGGELWIGVEDAADQAPAGQAVPPDLPDHLVRRMRELTVNVAVAVSLQTAANGGQFIVLAVARALGVASTVDGRYALRIDDTCCPVTGDDMARLLNDRPARPWESPLGVTPQTILHASRRRNDGLARVFHDLGLMECEGSGFDLMYERLLASGRPAPVATEGVDSVCVMVSRRIVKPQVILLIDEADKRFQLSQRERITLGVLAQADGLTAVQLCRQVEVAGADALKPWLGRLVALGLVRTTGRTQALRYFVDPGLLRDAKVPALTSLVRIEPHRLRALILEDLALYPGSASSEVNARVGAELSLKTIKRALDELAALGEVVFEGERRWRRYRRWPIGQVGG